MIVVKKSKITAMRLLLKTKMIEFTKLFRKEYWKNSGNKCVCVCVRVWVNRKKGRVVLFCLFFFVFFSLFFMLLLVRFFCLFFFLCFESFISLKFSLIYLLFVSKVLCS